MSHHVVSDLLPRGVYLPPYFDEQGHAFLIVINSKHRRIWQMRLFNTDSLPAAKAMCQALLDKEDPPKVAA
jgi:hypothetical protein